MAGRWNACLEWAPKPLSNADDQQSLAHTARAPVSFDDALWVASPCQEFAPLGIQQRQPKRIDRPPAETVCTLQQRGECAVIASFWRGVAQLGSAPLWGSGGRGFKSRRSDFKQKLKSHSSSRSSRAGFFVIWIDVASAASIRKAGWSHTHPLDPEANGPFWKAMKTEKAAKTTDLSRQQQFFKAQ